MARKTKTELKRLFEMGDKPTQEDFQALIDETYNSAESILPPVENNAGKFLATDGIETSWQTITIPTVPVNEAPIDGRQYSRKNAGWSETVVPTVPVLEAPVDGKQYSRKDAGWDEIIIPAPPAVPVQEAPVDGKSYTRKDAGWSQLTNIPWADIDKTGAIASDVGALSTTPNEIKFNTNPNGTEVFETGKVYYDAANKTISAMIDDEVIMQVGQEELALCYNNTGTDIPNGTMVYINGAVGDMPTIGYAIADTNAIVTGSYLSIGMTTQLIPDNMSGFVTARGIVHDCNTSAFESGDTLYLSTTVPGGVTNVAPTDPSVVSIKIGTALRIDASSGSIYINRVPHNRLTDLDDVTITVPVVDQILKYNGSEWINGSMSTVNAGNGISFFIADVPILVGGTQTVALNSLYKTPYTQLETTESRTVTNSTVLIDRYLYDFPLGGTQIDGGVWTFNMYNMVDSSNAISSMPITVRKAELGTGTITMTGTGTTRTATVSGSTPFLPSDAGADLTLGSLIQTSDAIFRINGYTSSSEVTVETLSTYVNNVGSSFYIHRHLFTDSTIEINNTTVGLNTSYSTQPPFPINSTDKLSISIYARTNSTPQARTITLYHGGTERNSHFNTPLVVRHNDLAGIQGGNSTERYHLSSAEYTDKITNMKFGGATHYSQFESDGTLVFNGNATVWDDLIGAITSLKTTGAGVSLNATEQTIEFTVAANMSDFAWIPFQLSHRWKGSNIHPHLHWEQTLNAVPNFLMRYRWQKLGGTKTTAWTDYVCNTPVFAYTSGTLNQICHGAGITPPVGYNISDIVQIQVFRDSANSTGLFGGANVYAATVGISSIDIHIEIDTVGSRSEFNK